VRASKPIRLSVASSNPGKLREFQVLAGPENAGLELLLLPNFASLPPFEENAPTFAENAVGKAIHYSRHCEGLLIADDSGLVVPALGGEPGVHSARYAGPEANDADRNRKLLAALSGKIGGERAARFVCVLAIAQRGEVRAVFSASGEGEILDAPRGLEGFGYDPVFYVPSAGKTFAELSREEKNRYSHRGKAFRKALEYLAFDP
jgi:XTP/dITP diphosphohydrolase